MFEAKSWRDWVKELPARLGERKFRLLVSAWSRSLLEPAFDKAVAKETGLGYVQHGVLEIFEVVDRFTDTGKSKAALKEALKNLERLGDSAWPVATGRALVAALLSREPGVTLDVCATAHMITHSLPRESLISGLQELANDLTPPAGDVASIDPSFCTKDVLELAQSIYQKREFQRMPELADALERAGCRNAEAMVHCRATNGMHIRGCWVLDAVLGERVAKPKSAAPPPGSLKRHLLLGKVLHDTLEVALQCLARSEEQVLQQKAAGQNQQFARTMHLEDGTSYVVLEHLGYGPIEGLEARMHTAVDSAIDYFFGDWWKANEDDARALDKSRPDRELQWSGPLMRGLLLAGLTSRWDDVIKLSSWVDHSLQWEPRFEMNDYEMQWFDVCIASELRPTPLSGIGELLGQIRECRASRPRLLCAIWVAILGNDQKAYAAALKASVAHFLKMHAENVSNVNYWVALDESLLALIAQHRGLAFPKLPEKLDAAVVRRETLPALVGRTQ